ncbi:MAG: hypothetical protein WC451_05525, partial [Patescibacteria group bacterium]
MNFRWIKNLALYIKGMFEARKIKSSSKIKSDIKEQQKQAYTDAKRQAEIAVQQAEQKEKELALEIKGIENADKLKIGRLKRIHQRLLSSSSLYRKWNSNPNVGFHNIGLASVLVLTFLFTSIILYGPMYKRALADAHTCTWLGATDTNWTTATNWTCNDGHSTPDSTNNIAFVTNPTYGLTLTSNQTVVGVTSTTAGMNGTFNTNGYSLTVNGDLIWQAGTLNASASEITISGNLDLSGGTFTQGLSTIVLTGDATDFTPASGMNLYRLIIRKNTNSTPVTIQANDFNVQKKLSMEKGKLNGSGRTLTLTATDNYYQIGDNYYIGVESEGGSASIKITAGVARAEGGFGISAGGGLANDLIEVNGSGIKVVWNGSAQLKDLVLTDGTLSIESGKLSFPADGGTLGANGKLSCATGKALTIGGQSHSSAGDMVILRSRTPGSQWYFENNCGTVAATYVDVKDSINSNGTVIATNAFGNGKNNSGWNITDLAVKTWDSVGSDEWDVDTNWSGGTKPTTSDIVYFGSSYSNTDCTLPAGNTTVAGIISSDYGGTLYSTSNNFTSTEFNWSSGVFNAGSSTITTTSDTNLSGGTYTATTGKFLLRGNGGSNNSKNFIPGSSSFYDLEVNCTEVSWRCSYSLLGIANVAHDFLNTDSYDYSFNVGLIRITHDLIVAANGNRGSAIAELTGSGDQVIFNATGGKSTGISINKISGTVTFNDNISLSGDWLYRRGSFSHNNKKLTWVGSGEDNITRPFVPGEVQYYDLEEAACITSWTCTLNIYGIANVSHDYYYTSVYSGDPGGPGQVNVGGNVYIGTSVGTTNSTQIVFNGSSDQTISSTGGNSPKLAVNKSSGTVRLGSDITTAGVNQIAGYTGTLDTNGYNLQTDSNFIWLGGTFTAAGESTLKFYGQTSHGWTPGSGTYANVVYDSAGNPGYNLTITGTANVAGNFTVTLGGVGGGTINLGGNLAINGQSGGSTVININGSGDQTLYSAAVGDCAPSITISKDTGTVSLISDFYLSNNWVYSKGNFSASSYNIIFYYQGSKSWTPGSATYYGVELNTVGNCGFNMVLTGTATISHQLKMSCGYISGGTINLSGDLVTVAANDQSGTVAVNMVGSGIQTVTTSSGYIPGTTLTINKPSGKAVFTTAAGTGVINNNIDLQAGTLEFGPRVDGDNTFTITNTKSITTSAGTILRFAGNSTYKPILVSSSPSNRWTLSPSGEVYANYVNVTDSNNTVGTIYAMNSTATNCLGWDTTSDTTTWTAGSGGWSTDANWDNGKPDANDVAIINSTDESVAVTTSENISFGTLTIGGDTTYTNQLTLSNDIDSGGDLTVTSNGTFTQSNNWSTALTLGGFVNVTGVESHLGTITHGDNSTAETYRLNMVVGDSMTVDTYGQVNADALGYDEHSGPGSDGPSLTGGGYGGMGGTSTQGTGGSTYGSPTDPTNLGSGGQYNTAIGGGAISLNVGGLTTISGLISATGQAGIASAGSGGSIKLITGTLSKSGNIIADGGYSGHDAAGSGGGGRIAIYLGNTADFGSGLLTAYGGSRIQSRNAGAGTIFTKTQGQTNGSIKIDNGDTIPNPLSGTAIPIASKCAGHTGCESWTLDTINVDNAGDLQVPSGTTLNISSNSVLSSGVGTVEGFISHRGGTISVPENFTISKATLNVDWVSGNAYTLDHLLNLTIASDGKLSHTDNSTMSTTVFRLNLSIPNNLTVTGSVNTDYLGYDDFNGPGSTTALTGGSYGGAGGTSGNGTAGPTYGSVTNPTEIGSGGQYTGANGGGAIILTVGGQTILSGSISANGKAGSYAGAGSGGSINLTTGTFSKTGSVTANGANSVHDATGGGGGGRIAITIGSGSDLGSGLLTANGGSRIVSRNASAGTIFTKVQGQTNGSLTIDNNSLSSTQRATLFGEGTNCDDTCDAATATFDSITLSNSGKLALVEHQTLNYSHDLTIPSGSELAFSGDADGDPSSGNWPTFNMTGDLTVSGTLSATGLGFDVASGSGPGKGSGTTNGGGGGFGGTGGDGSGETGTGGAVYGGAKDLVYLGSPGGTAGGGTGGGHIQLNITGNLDMDGEAASNAYISANGNNGTTNGGGGSGGAIYVWVSENFTADSDSHVFAKGGNGAGAGGGGGGGRIYVVTKGTRPADSVFSVDGGTGVPNSGSVGTYTKNSYDAIPTLSGPANHATNQMQNISMTMVSTDPDGDWLRYRIQMTGQESAPGVPDFGATYAYTFTQGATAETQTVTDTKTVGGQSREVSGSYTNQNGAGSPAGTGYASGLTATFSVSISSPLVYGQKYYWKVSAIDPGGVNDYTDYSEFFDFTVASVRGTYFTAGLNQTLQATDSCSEVLTVETRNTVGQVINLLSNTTFNLSAGQTGGGFYSNSNCTTPITQVTITTGNHLASFYYKNTTSYIDPFNLSLAETPSQSWTNETTTVQIDPGNLDHFNFASTVFPTTITTDDTFPTPANDITVAAYDSLNNIKFDYTGLIYFTTTCDSYASPCIVPYTATSKYTFTGEGADNGDHVFAGSSFQYKKTGAQKITLHWDTYGIEKPAGTLDQSGTTTVSPGALSNWLMEDYPKAISPTFPRYVNSGYDWDQGMLNGAAHEYNVKITARDQYNNTKTDYYGDGKTVWFELHTSANGDAEWSWTPPEPWSGYSYYQFSQADAGTKTFDGATFTSTTSGNNLKFKATNGTVLYEDNIYVKPGGLGSFTLETTPTLSRDGTNWDKAVDTNWTEVPTVTAFDAMGHVKVDYQYDDTTKEGMIYFYSPQRLAHSSGVPLTNQENPYYKYTAASVDQCFQFPNENLDGTHSFNDGEAFKLYKGGRRTVYVSECLDPTSEYATTSDNGKRFDPNFESATEDRPNPVSTGVMPATNPPEYISGVTHVPGTTHSSDDHSSNANDNFTIGPGDKKLSLSWLNPFDAPTDTGTDAKIYIYQSTNGVDYSLLDSPRPTVNSDYSGPGLWQSVDVTGLTNDQPYWYKLKLGYKRPNNTVIYSEFSIAQTETPKAIAPVNVVAKQLDRDGADQTATLPVKAEDTNHPGEVRVDYSLRYTSTVTFSYFNPSNLSWNLITDSAVSGDKGLVSGNDQNPEEPIDHTTYIEMNTDFEESFLNGSFKIRINVDVSGQGTSNSESPVMRLDTKNPANTSMIIKAEPTNDQGDIDIYMTDDSAPVLMKICNNDANADTCSGSWEAYSTSKTDWHIVDADRVYITFKDLYNNQTQIYKDVLAAPEAVQIKDGSNIVSNKFRLVVIWNDTVGAHHYNIWRKTDQNSNYTLIDTTTKNGYLDNNLDQNFTYTYRVMTEDVLGNISPPTNEVSARPGSAPDVSQNPTVELYGWKQDQGVRAKITWNTDQPSTSYVAYSTDVLHAGADNTADNGAIVKIVGSPDLNTSHEIWLYNLEPQTKYYFKAFSANEIQIIGYSSVLDFTTPAKVALLISGMKITDITMTGALVDWETSKAATTVLEYGSTTSYGSTLTDANFNIDHTFKLENLDSGVEYNLRAKVTDSDGNTTISDNYTFQTPAMPIISGVAVSQTTFDSATISWTTNVNTDSNVSYDGPGGTEAASTAQASTTSSSQTPTKSGSGMQGKPDSTTVHSVTLIGLEAKTSY